MLVQIVAIVEGRSVVETVADFVARAAAETEIVQM